MITHWKRWVPRCIGAALGALVLAAPAIGAGQATKKVLELKLDNVASAESINGQDVVFFAQQVDKLSNGQIKVNVFHQGALTGGSGQVALEQVVAGTLDLSYPTTGYYGNVLPALQVLSLPFYYPSYDSMENALQGRLGQMLHDQWTAKGVKVLGWYPRTGRQLTNSRGRIVKPEDMKGLKIRVIDSPIYTSTMKLFGANPTPMPWGEVYTALQLKVIHAQENPIDVIRSEKVYEVQKFVTVWDYSADALFLMMNLKKWESLSPEQKNVLQEAANLTRARHRDAVLAAYASGIEFVRAQGMTVDVLTPEQKAAFQQVVAPIWSQFAPTIGKAVMEAAAEGLK
jgi:tripartite ATP-independent transporter DctP family solute receptor